MFLTLHSITTDDLKSLGIIRVPQDVYQMMADVIDPRLRLEQNQERIKKILLDWLEETYPDKVLESFEEITSDQALLLQNKIRGITFGFYVKLLNKQNHEKINLLASNPSISNSK